MKSINSRFFVTRVREMAVIPLLSCKEGGKGFAEVFVLRLYSRKGNRSDTSLPKFIEQKKRQRRNSHCKTTVIKRVPPGNYLRKCPRDRGRKKSP